MATYRTIHRLGSKINYAVADLYSTHLALAKDLSGNPVKKTLDRIMAENYPNSWQRAFKPELLRV